MQSKTSISLSHHKVLYSATHKACDVHDDRIEQSTSHPKEEVFVASLRTWASSLSGGSCKAGSVTSRPGVGVACWTPQQTVSTGRGGGVGASTVTRGRGAGVRNRSSRKLVSRLISLTTFSSKRRLTPANASSLSSPPCDHSGVTPFSLSPN